MCEALTIPRNLLWTITSFLQALSRYLRMFYAWHGKSIEFDCTLHIHTSCSLYSERQVNKALIRHAIQPICIALWIYTLIVYELHGIVNASHVSLFNLAVVPKRLHPLLTQGLELPVPSVGWGYTELL